MVAITRLILLLGLVSLSFVPLIARAEEPTSRAAAIEFFEKKIRPLLAENCYTCHSANTNTKGGLRVDDRNGLLNGGEGGPAIIPGEPERSRLIRAVSHVDQDLKMPPNKQLSAEQVADLARWVRDGAAWPPTEVPEHIGKPIPEYDALRKEHWAWQALRVTQPTSAAPEGWARDTIDEFIWQKLQEQGLRPSGDADRQSLVRRLSFDLTGLPPRLEDIDAFLADASPDAWERMVDRLLAAPAFGETWGRHWLDVARYGESTGSSRNIPFPHAWRYRDYVIGALNQDKPYNQFIREQIAGDLLPASSPEQREEQLTATGFLALGVKDVNQRFKVRFVMDNIDEQIDTVSRAVLSLTASCARCHDHKFDPIPTTDYYALAGIFHSTDLCAGVRNKMGGGGLDYYDTAMLLRLDAGNAELVAGDETLRKVEQLKVSVAEAKAEFETLRGKPAGNEPGPDGRPKRAIARQKWNKLQAELAAYTDPASNGGRVAFGVRDAKNVDDTEVRIRGEAEQLGPVVPRGFLGVLQVPETPIIPPGQSGRLQLADWLTSDSNPLTARVIVNRVWQHLFGQGLVRSVDNFGTTGDLPSHPELLDHLAARLIRDGWSIKRLIRSVVLTRTYQLSAAASVDNLAADPDNRWLWRHAPRRLAAEELRDTMLSAAGNLNVAPGVASPARELKVVELRNNGPEARRLTDTARASQHRSVYLPLLRGITPTSLEVFDFAEQGMVTGRRDATTVAPQALYLLNDPFVRRQALDLAERLLARREIDDVERINRAYRVTLGRTANSREIERALRFLADFANSAHDVVATSSPVPPAEEAVATADTVAPTKKKPMPQNPDEVDQTDEPVATEVVQPRSPQAAAWASLCQALLGSAEFRYLQ